MHDKGINNIYVTLTNDRQDYLVSPTADRKIRGTVGGKKKINFKLLFMGRQV